MNSLIIEETPMDRMYSIWAKSVDKLDIKEPEKIVGTLNETISRAAQTLQEGNLSSRECEEYVTSMISMVLQTYFKDKVIHISQLSASDWKFWNYFATRVHDEFNSKHSDFLSLPNRKLSLDYRKDVILTLVGLHNWGLLQHPTYYITSDLSVMLTQTKIDNVPLEFIKLPYNSIVVYPLNNYLLTLPALEELVATGAIPQNASLIILCVNEYYPEYGELIKLKLGVSQGLKDTNVTWVFTTAVAVNQDATIGAVARDAKYDGDYMKTRGRTLFKEAEVYNTVGTAITNYMLSILIYLTTPDADVILGKDSPEYRAWANAMSRKKKQKLQRKNMKRKERMETQRRFIVGNSFRIIDRHDEKDNFSNSDTDEKRASPCIHWRRGHFRAVVCGEGRNERKVQWIQPTIVGHRGQLQRVNYKAR